MEQYLLFHQQQRQFVDIPIHIKNGKSGNVTLSQDTCNLTITGTNEAV